MVFIPESVARVLERPLAERPDAEAVVARSGSLTYAELDAAADRAAAALWGLGVRPGDRVAASLPNDLDVVVAFHGAMRLGAIWVGVNAALAPVEKLDLLADCAASVLLADAEAIAQVAPKRARLDRLSAIVGEGGDERWSELMAAAGERPSVDIDPFAPAGIAYTSGTTGKPKGIVHSQHNLVLPGAVVVASRGYGPDLRKGDCLPLTILNLQVLTSLLTAQAGGTCIVMDRRDQRGIIEWIREQEINVWNGVPTQLYDLARSGIDPVELKSLNEVWCGGADCSQSLRDDFERAFGVPLRATYGLTEAPTIVAMDPVGQDYEPGASGHPLPHLSISVLDDSGAPAKAREVGEITVSATTEGEWAGQWRPALGLWDDGSVVAGPADVLSTGDLGELEDGWLSIRDRRNLLILRGGANIYPAEVERVLLAVDGVAGAAVFGYPDERLGQRVAAAVEMKKGDAAVPVEHLLKACIANLAAYKVPDRWTFVSELPRNAMGKVTRSKLLGLLD